MVQQQQPDIMMVGASQFMLLQKLLRFSHHHNLT